MNRVLVLLIVLVSACSEEQGVGSPAAPVTMSEEAVGHYCQMNVLDHDGPKAQVHLSGNDHPIWFVQIRDAFAFDRMPEQPAQVVAIYVSDMGAPDAEWNSPGADNWIAADAAYYVSGSKKRGGMGAPDFIPFSRRADAVAFSEHHGGNVVAYEEITDAAVLAPVEVDLPNDAEPRGGGS